MVKHVVLWKLKENAEGSDRKANAIKLKKMLEALQTNIPGAYKLEVGINYNPAGYDVVLNSQFNDYDTLESYQIHPDHIRVKEFIQKVAADRVVADYIV